MRVKGLVDKTHWRFDGAPNHAHCFVRVGREYVSLCRRLALRRIGGQRCLRPAAVLRCAACDLAEMKLRGVSESMPESKERRRWVTTRTS